VIVEICLSYLSRYLDDFQRRDAKGYSNKDYHTDEAQEYRQARYAT